MDYDSALQSLCRGYLVRLRPLVERFGLGRFVDDMVEMNSRSECSGTEEEVRILSRMCDDERVNRTDVPNILGKSYRQTVEDGDFERVERLPRVGIYSKVSALLLRFSNPRQ